ncbi:MAG: ribosomal protein bL12 [Candidatus Nasuia deltocephalinicola]
MNIYNNILNLIENMTIFELNNLINLLDSKYNFSKNNNYTGTLKVEEKPLKEYKYSVYLSDIGKNKISLIKIIKEINNLGLKEAKDLVESCPSLIKKGVDEINVKIIKEKLESVGATCEIKKDE